MAVEPKGGIGMTGLDQLHALLGQSDNIVFFGGAGVSTESGIPDFRSVDGLYHTHYRYPPETILSHRFFESHPDEFYTFYRDKMLCLDVYKRQLLGRCVMLCLCSFRRIAVRGCRPEQLAVSHMEQIFEFDKNLIRRFTFSSFKHLNSGNRYSYFVGNVFLCPFAFYAFLSHF